jgi:hypothetical protein
LIVEWIASYSRGMPLLSGVVPNIPLVATRDSAFVTPNIGLAVHKLIDIELNRLRGANVIAKKINVVYKVVRLGVDAIVAIGQPSRRELPDQVVIPKYVGECRLAADIELHRFAAERGRTYALIT